MTQAVPRRRVLALLGTDYHPFDRAVGWLDQWAADHPDVDVTVQYGRSRPPTVATGRDFLEHAELTSLIAESDVVVSHGGPATISEARAAGHLPVVVPRDPSQGEHVDDHQLRFTAWLAGKGFIDRHTDASTFGPALESALDRDRTESAAADEAVEGSVARLERMVTQARSHRRVRPTDGPTVVFIAGFGRSGSTLLERLLGESPGITCLGEVVHLWERGLTNDERCACGEPFSGCPTWMAIGDRAFGGWSRVDVKLVLELRRLVDRQRRIPVTASPVVSRTTRQALVEYAGYYAAIYHAAAALAGSSVIVDSSKHVSLAFALSHDVDLDLRIVHLIRDARAVAYSWSRDVERPETTSQRSLMPQYSAAGSGRRWLTSNLLADSLRLRGLPVTRVRYEDLVCDPEQTLTALACDLALPVSPKLDVVDGQVVLGASHSVAGNPMRFVTGPITLRLDDAWAQDMPAGDRRVVTALTAPVQRWYSR